jgi:chromosome segregation ATPase
LERQIEEGENAMATLNKTKISLTTQLEDTKRLGDGEARDRSSMLTKFKTMTTELEATREKIEDEHQRKSDALKALSKAQSEIQLWRSRYETEGMGRVDELETSRSKLQARIQEAEETVESLTNKIASAEKSKVRLQSDLEEISMDYERTHAAAIITEKRGRNFDKVVGEWKAKADDIAMEVEASQKEARNYSSEVFRLKAAHD